MKCKHLGGIVSDKKLIIVNLHVFAKIPKVPRIRSSLLKKKKESRINLRQDEVFVALELVVGHPSNVAEHMVRDLSTGGAVTKSARMPQSAGVSSLSRSRRVKIRESGVARVPCLIVLKPRERGFMRSTMDSRAGARFTGRMVMGG